MVADCRLAATKLQNAVIGDQIGKGSATFQWSVPFRFLRCCMPQLALNGRIVIMIWV